MERRKFTVCWRPYRSPQSSWQAFPPVTKKELEPNKVPQEFRYQTTVFGAKDSQRILLDSLTASITDIANSASWLKATVAPDDGRHAIDIESTSPETDLAEATLTVTDADGNHAQVTVYHRPHLRSDGQSGSNGDTDRNWIENWWTFQTVALEGISSASGEVKPQRTPWEPDGTLHAPEEVRVHYKPSQGWEMAFSVLNDPSLIDTRYFALYNKFTGQMRVFTYINKPSGWGSEILFHTYFGSQTNIDLYPLYNVFEYGIPTCHEPGGNTLLQNARLVKSQSQTFETWLSPYKDSDSGLTGGWHCFDFDMSGYVPKGHDWLRKGENAVRFRIVPETKKQRTSV
jgi:hypothetical protein